MTCTVTNCKFNSAHMTAAEPECSFNVIGETVSYGDPFCRERRILRAPPERPLRITALRRLRTPIQTCRVSRILVPGNGEDLPHPGDHVEILSRFGDNQNQTLGRARCNLREPLSMTFDGLGEVTFGSLTPITLRLVPELEAFAVASGFYDWLTFRNFYSGRGPWKGHIIGWDQFEKMEMAA